MELSVDVKMFISAASSFQGTHFLAFLLHWSFDDTREKLDLYRLFPS